MRVTDHTSETFEVSSVGTIVGKTLDGELVSVSGYVEHYQFSGPMEAEQGGEYITTDDTHLIYTFRDRPPLVLRWGDLVDANWADAGIASE